MTRTALIFQGGGPTAVINASLAGALSTGLFNRVLGLPFSLDHVSAGAVIDLSHLARPDAAPARAMLAATPGAALGSSRTPVDEHDVAAVVRLARRERAEALIGVGGNGTMSVLGRIAAADDALRVIGAPKTVDNDLPATHVSPGFASAARHIAVSARDLAFDAASMSHFDDVTILETMGRNTGWLAVAAASLGDDDQTRPDFVLCPERPVDPAALIAAVAARRREKGWAFIVVNEMLRGPDGAIFGADPANWPKDRLGRTMYSLSAGVGAHIADLLRDAEGLQCRVLRPSILGRCDTRAVVPADRDLAWRCGARAAELAAGEGPAGVMVAVGEDLGLTSAPFAEVTGTRRAPPEFLGGGYGITDAARRYMRRLIGPVDPILPAIFPYARPSSSEEILPCRL